MELFDENKAVEYINNALIESGKSAYPEDEILNVIDMIWDYYEENGLLEIDANFEADEDEDISIENISYHILTLKEYLDENDVSFYALNFVLEDPTNIDNNVYVMIKSSDIYVENFESRLIKSIKETEEFYKEEDSLKTDELGIN